jgi:hypothetical protein
MDENVILVLMPKKDLVKASAVLTRWLVKDGEWIEAGQAFFAYESEKVESESDRAGQRIRAPAGGSGQQSADQRAGG